MDRAVQFNVRPHDMSLLLLFNQQRPAPPELTIKALLEFAGQTTDGALVEAVAIPWFEILEMVKKDPQSIYSIEPRTWEEIIAGAYSRAGFDEVILTPRSGDKGRDVVATKRGIGCVRIFDQVKAYKPGNVVTAEEVRAMLGVITGAQNVSKGVITTTSEFAPRLLDDEFLKPYIPYRLELKAREPLLAWLDELSEHES
jgi:restriction system protein